MDARYVILMFVFSMAASTAQIVVPKYKLNNGREIPAVALGTFLGHNGLGIVRSKDNMLRDVVLKAIDVGYRHFDTASVYGTEAEVGEAVRTRIQEGNITRDDVFITTKLWNTHHKKDQVIIALKESLRQLGLDYVDLYLMHWPIALNENYTFSDTDYLETWQAMEEAVEAGLTKSIGVCNFNKNQLSRLVNESIIKPAVLQIEIHLQKPQPELVHFARFYKMVVMGFSPFGTMVKRFGIENVGLGLQTEPLPLMANIYRKTTAQVVLAWFVQRKIIPIPKTVTISRLMENIDIFDFKMTENHIFTLGVFNINWRCVLPSFWQDHPHYPFERVEKPIRDPFVKALELNAAIS